MYLNKDRQSFAKTVAVIIAFQGLAWCGLAITGIVVYTSPPIKLKNDIQSYERYIDYLSRIIYDEVMGGTRSRVIEPTDFVVFLWIYTIFSALWFAASVDQYAAIHYKKRRQSIVTLVLGILVLVTSIIDLVFVSLLARDLDTCHFNLTTATEAVSTTESTTTTSTTAPIVESLPLLQSSYMSLRNTVSTSTGTPIDCQLANGIVMTVAARGFVLWAINVVLAISLITIGAKVLRTPTLLNYEKNTIPRVRAPEFRTQSFPNDMVFLGDNDVFGPPPPPQQNDSRNRNSTPVALTNKNQTIYY